MALSPQSVALAVKTATDYATSILSSYRGEYVERFKGVWIQFLNRPNEDYRNYLKQYSGYNWFRYQKYWNATHREFTQFKAQYEKKLLDEKSAIQTELQNMPPAKPVLNNKAYTKVLEMLNDSYKTRTDFTQVKYFVSITKHLFDQAKDGNDLMRKIKTEFGEVKMLAMNAYLSIIVLAYKTYTQSVFEQAQTEQKRLDEIKRQNDIKISTGIPTIDPTIAIPEGQILHTDIVKPEIITQGINAKNRKFPMILIAFVVWFFFKGKVITK